MSSDSAISDSDDRTLVRLMDRTFWKVKKVKLGSRSTKTIVSVRLSSMGLSEGIHVPRLCHVHCYEFCWMLFASNFSSVFLFFTPQPSQPTINKVTCSSLKVFLSAPSHNNQSKLTKLRMFFFQLEFEFISQQSHTQQGFFPQCLGSLIVHISVPKNRWRFLSLA